jgi:hypothetical protein
LSYHQFIPGESHDMDEVFESVLIDYDGRHSLFKMGKLGILGKSTARPGASWPRTISGTRLSTS